MVQSHRMPTSLLTEIRDFRLQGGGGVWSGGGEGMDTEF